MSSSISTSMTIIASRSSQSDIVPRNKTSSLNSNQKCHKQTFKISVKSISSEPERGSVSSANETSPSGPNCNLSKSPKSYQTPKIPDFVPILASFWTMITSKVLKPPSLHPSVDPKLVLTGNFAPVGETSPTECLVVEGEIPPSLNGAYIRNGPNPQYQPSGPHHLWSGDGMLHSIRLSNGRAIFCSRFVQTYKYMIEHDKGFPIVPNFLSGFYSVNDIYHFVMSLGKAMSEHINLNESFGLANTNLAFFHGSLFALMEGDLPYKIKLTQESDIKTLQRYDFVGKAPLNMTAHPLIDTETKELFAFQLDTKYPYLSYLRFDATGSNPQSVPIFSMNRPTYVHDFAITKHFAIFPDSQLEISLFNLLLCKGIPLSYQANKDSRIGIIPRYATSDSEMIWFQVPGFNAFHILNAWEEENNLVIITPTISCPNNFLYSVDDFHMYLEKITINMKTNNVSRTTLSELSVEMGSINQAYCGKKNRYVYMAVAGSSLKMSGLVKIDLELESEVASMAYGPGCFGGEAYFVAATDHATDSDDEDDGYVVSFVHNETTDQSYFYVYDAKSLDIVCKVKLPGRVPYGLHGLFVYEEQLQNL